MIPEETIPTPAPSPSPGSSLPPTQIPPPQPSPFPARLPAETQRTAYVILMPGDAAADDILAKSHDVADLLEQATAHRGYADPDARPYLRYNVFEDRIFQEAKMPPKLPKGAAKNRPA